MTVLGIEHGRVPIAVDLLEAVAGAQGTGLRPDCYYCHLFIDYVLGLHGTFQQYLKIYYTWNFPSQIYRQHILQHLSVSNMSSKSHAESHKLKIMVCSLL